MPQSIYIQKAASAAAASAAAAAIGSIHVGVVIFVLLQVGVTIVTCFSPTTSPTTTITTTTTTNWSIGDSRRCIVVGESRHRSYLLQNLHRKTRNNPLRSSFSSSDQLSSTMTEQVKVKQDNNDNVNVKVNTNSWNISFVDVDDTLNTILTDLQDNHDNKSSTVPLFPPPELSPYYHRDKEDPLYKPIAHPEQISTLLRRRYNARQTKQGSQLAQLDRILLTKHGVLCHDDGVNPDIIGVWTRRRRPPQRYQGQRVNIRKQRHDQSQPATRNEDRHSLIDCATNSYVCNYTLDSVTSRHLSISDIQQMMQTYQQRCNDGDYESARLLQYQAKLQGLFLHFY
jgi:hypothetical protein